MGTAYEGGMLVGRHGRELPEITSDWLPDDWEGNNEEDIESLSDWEILEELELDMYCNYFDADKDGSYIGFEVNNVSIDDPDFDKWVEEVKVKSKEFEDITGVKAKLIGCQHIY